ncbi:MAG: transposase InsO family protein [Bradymonadia bacterium]|jgi:transposase InsO family protein
MRRSGLVARGRKKFKATTDSNHSHPIAPNLLDRNFAPSGPNEAWVGDITYVYTAQGWLYLAVISDLFSRRLVGCLVLELIRSTGPPRGRWQAVLYKARWAQAGSEG